MVKRFTNLQYRFILGLTVVGLLAVLLTHLVNERSLFQYREARPLMGTLVEITLEGETKAQLAPAADAAFSEMQRLSNMMNHYDPQSVVSEINRLAGIAPVNVPAELQTVLKMAQAVSYATHGAFDITIGGLKGWRFEPDDPAMPSSVDYQKLLALVDYHKLQLDELQHTAYLSQSGMAIDLGGIAKLFIIHQGIETLKKHKIAHAMVNGGGDVEVIGTYTGHPWRVGVRSPQDAEKMLVVLDISGGFVTTSGDYERYFIKDNKRYHHILDPRTGYPAQSPRQVTLIAKNLAMINGYSAAMMVLGVKAGQAFIERSPEMDAIIINQDNKIWATERLKNQYPYIPSQLK